MKELTKEDLLKLHPLDQLRLAIQQTVDECVGLRGQHNRGIYDMGKDILGLIERLKEFNNLGNTKSVTCGNCEQECQPISLGNMCNKCYVEL